MKFLIVTTFILCIIFISSCEKEDNDCKDSKPEACYEKVPDDEMCTAYFERWFYIEETNSCEKIGYSGCSEWGFASQEECEQCGCE